MLLHIFRIFYLILSDSEPSQLGRFQAVLNSNQYTYSEMFKYFIACPTSWMPGSQGHPALSLARARWQALASREMDPLLYPPTPTCYTTTAGPGGPPVSIRNFAKKY